MISTLPHGLDWELRTCITRRWRDQYMFADKSSLALSKKGMFELLSFECTSLLGCVSPASDNDFL